MSENSLIHLPGANEIHVLAVVVQRYHPGEEPSMANDMVRGNT